LGDEEVSDESLSDVKTNLEERLLNLMPILRLLYPGKKLKLVF